MTPIQTGQEWFVYSESGQVAGPFKTHGEAWSWIDRKGIDKPTIKDPAPMPPERQPRTNTSITAAEVERYAPLLLAKADLPDNARGFVGDLMRQLDRKPLHIRTTEKQAGWWRGLVKKHEVRA